MISEHAALKASLEASTLEQAQSMLMRSDAGQWHEPLTEIFEKAIGFDRKFFRIMFYPTVIIVVPAVNTKSECGIVISSNLFGFGKHDVSIDRSIPFTEAVNDASKTFNVVLKQHMFESAQDARLIVDFNNQYGQQTDMEKK